jgi:isocitrate dehydrogenase kinase/phosphatase
MIKQEPPLMIKQEPPFMINNPDDLNNNTNRIITGNSQDNSLSNMISDDSNCYGSNNQNQNNFSQVSCASSVTDIQQDIKPSVINMANSRLLNMENNNSFCNSSSNVMSHHNIKQELITPDNNHYNINNRLVQNNNMSTILSDIDLDEFPDTIMDDMDFNSGFNLNDQDFTSIKSIVEQTFKDGRDVLDIISAV